MDLFKTVFFSTTHFMPELDSSPPFAGFCSALQNVHTLSLIETLMFQTHKHAGVKEHFQVFHRGLQTALKARFSFAISQK